MVAGVLATAGASANEASTALDAVRWTNIAPGVFQASDESGAIIRQSFGDDGARYDLVQFKNQLNEALANHGSSAETIASLRQAVEELTERVRVADAIKIHSPPALIDDAARSNMITASTGLFGYNNTPTPICGFVAHQLADFSGNAAILPGGGDGSATSSIAYYIYSFASYTATIFVSATTTPYGGSPNTVSGSISVSTASSSGGPTLFSRTSNSIGLSFSVTASTSSYINVAGCSGGYQSFTKTQAL